MGKGDQLASGRVRAVFETPQVDQKTWNERFDTTEGAKLNVMSEEDRLKVEQETTEGAAKLAETQVERKRPENAVPFRAVQDRIVVARLDEEEKVGGLYVPDEGKEKPQEGLVVAVGPGKYVNGELQKVGVRPGERVLFGKFSGQEIKVGFQVFLILREEDLFIVRE